MVIQDEIYAALKCVRGCATDEQFQQLRKNVEAMIEQCERAAAVKAREKTFSDLNFGREVRIEQFGREIHLIFVAKTQERADNIIERMLAQLAAGALYIRVGGKPTSIEETLAQPVHGDGDKGSGDLW